MSKGSAATCGKPLVRSDSLGLGCVAGNTTISFEFKLLRPHLTNGVAQANMAVLVRPVEAAKRRTQLLTKDWVIDYRRLPVWQHCHHCDVRELCICDLSDLREAL